MNNVVAIPEGIDSAIQQVQTLLYDRLILSWGAMGLSNTNFQMYGRTYRNYRKDKGGNADGYAPESFIGGKDYVPDMFFDDKLAAIMWFGLNDPETITDQTQHNYKVSLYGFVNLESLKPGITAQRMDMAVTNDVLKWLERSMFKPTAVYRDIDHVLEKYSGALKKLALNQDMQPRFAFRIDMEIALRLDNCKSVAINYPAYLNPKMISYKVVFKDVPNTGLEFPLSNGIPAQFEFPTGSSVTIPYLAGKIILETQSLNNTIVELTYNKVTGTLASPQGGFLNDDVLIIDVNTF